VEAPLMRTGFNLDACMTADAMHRADMETASATMLSVLQGKMGAPPKLRWSRDVGGWGKRSPESDRRIAQLFAIERAIEGRRTSRDSCQRCGARGDAGCGHAPVVGGRLVAL
jgi:hypothetical protein